MHQFLNVFSVFSFLHLQARVYGRSESLHLHPRCPVDSDVPLRCPVDFDVRLRCPPDFVGRPRCPVDSDVHLRCPVDS